MSEKKDIVKDSVSGITLKEWCEMNNLDFTDPYSKVSYCLKCKEKVYK